jgi:L-alanine-DL-glutamate epimerase-like enolase superfamily enzyme
MLDANQRYFVSETVEVSQFITWLEEPVGNSLNDLTEIKRLSKIPVAMGENVIDLAEFEIICKDKLTEYLQPDIPRCEGITGFIEVAKMMMKHNIPLCNHLMYELSAGIISAYPSGYIVSAFESAVF